MTAAAPTVRAYLDADLGLQRVQTLERLAGAFGARPLAETVAELRAVLAAGPLDGEGFRRLHVLISYLYHLCGADIPLTHVLRDEVNAAFVRRGEGAGTSTSREEVTVDVVLEP